MSTIYECDRCGHQQKEKLHPARLTVMDHPSCGLPIVGWKADLCKACVDRLPSDAQAAAVVADARAAIAAYETASVIGKAGN